MIRSILAVALAAAAIPAGAESVPATNYSDLWDNSTPVPGVCPGNESGWGITFTQHADNRVEAVWYTYDPRQADSSSPGNFKPLWLVMPVGSWTSPTQYSGDMYVTVGTPFSQPWNVAASAATRVGTYEFDFNTSASGTFHYNVSPPGGVAATDPAFGLPAFSGQKPICRNQFP